MQIYKLIRKPSNSLLEMGTVFSIIEHKTVSLYHKMKFLFATMSCKTDDLLSLEGIFIPEN
jgi:hypothetical protein